MIEIIICIIITVVMCIIVYKDGGYERLSDTIMIGIICIILFWILLGLLIFPMGRGLHKDYGIVNQTGLLTNLSKQGVIWETFEGELQKGVNDQSTVSKPFMFSTTNEKIIKQLQSYLGSNKTIQLTCQQWYCMPYSRGNTDVEVISIKPIP